jgi:uncharacterized membrane protein YeiH
MMNSNSPVQQRLLSFLDFAGTFVFAVEGALAGAAIAVVGARYEGRSMKLAAPLGAVVCFLLRVVSVWRQWNLPRISGH